MTRRRCNHTKRKDEGVTPAVSALAGRMPADLVQLRAKPAQKPSRGSFVLLSR